ncbi:MAG: maleylpyruvate isomerase family mycothiol-dependent enzyme [Nocardioides sp.]
MSTPAQTELKRLADLVDLWWSAIEGFVDVLEQVPADQWSTLTDLPGWDIQACAAHTAHLEGILAGNPEETADVGELPHVTGLLGRYTEIGVFNRRNHSPQQIIAEIRDVTARRREWLRRHPPTDGSALPETVFGGVPWTWDTLLRNRPLDIWMHEQDVRRAADRPGNLDSPAARHTASYLADSLGYVLAKRVGAPSGTTAVLEIEGQDPVAFTVNAAGRGERIDAAAVISAGATVTLRCDRESFIVLAGGRRLPDTVPVTVDGDVSLGRRILAALATTP